jgi:hypothetical protein
MILLTHDCQMGVAWTTDAEAAAEKIVRSVFEATGSLSSRAQSVSMEQRPPHVENLVKSCCVWIMKRARVRWLLFAVVRSSKTNHSTSAV